MLRILLALALTVSFTSASHATPEGGAYGYAEKLIFASDTTFASDDGTRSLCVLVKDWSILSVPVYREVKGYVLADNACTGVPGTIMSDNAVEMLVESGIVRDAVPATADINAGWTIWTYAGGLLSLFGFMFFFLTRLRRKPIADIDAPVVTKHTPLFDETLLTTMFHTARLSGDINQITLQKLIKTYKTLSGQTVTQAMISAQYAQTTDTVDLLKIMPQFVGLERDTMMKACLDVAAADGEIAKPEHDFLMALGMALELDHDMFRNQIRAATPPARTRSTIINPIAPA